MSLKHIKVKPTLSLPEFAAMTAYMISLVALSIDAMLPVIDQIGEHFGTTEPNQPQLIIGMFFLGLVVGQLVYGPVSDTTGRKPAIYTGFFIFMLGCLLSMFAWDFNSLLAGRVLQGFGAAGPRIVAVAIVRDQYEGRLMAKITSIIMGFFVVVPAIAPAIGQAVIMVAPWQAIFVLFLGLSGLVLLWYGIRQRETLPEKYRREFSIPKIASGIWEVITHRISGSYTVAAGIVFGAFVAYLMTSPQLFADLFGVTDNFPYYFGALALAIGSAAVVNSALVMKYGMRRLCLTALSLQAFISIIFWGIAVMNDGQLTLVQFMIWAALAFFMLGILFGNFNAIAMEPLGHIAGIGSAVVGSFSGVISLAIGMAIGQAYHGTVLPIIGGFAILGLISIAIMKWADKGA